MKRLANTIEDLLEAVAGLHDTPKIKIEPNDATIVYSIARQSFNGIALTDRQFIVMKEKMQTYRDQFIALEYDFDTAVEALRLPLRDIDRSKYITIVLHGEMLGENQVYEFYKEKQKWIKVRFPFSKKLIIAVQDIVIDHQEYYHKKGAHEHYFLLTEKNVISVVSKLKDSSFDIDQELLTIYNRISKLKKEDYEIKVAEFTLHNLHPNGLRQLQNDLGTLSKENVIQYKDRSLLYGITSFDNVAIEEIEKHDILTKKIANRKSSSIFISSKEWSMSNLFNSLRVLNRYPIVILLNDKTPYDALIESYQCVRNYIDNSAISVLHRLSREESNGYNEFIQQEKLNNSLDKDTKIVYTSKSKINKPLLLSECKPITVLSLDSSRRSTQLNHWIYEFDLDINYADEPAIIPYSKASTQIEKI